MSDDKCMDLNEKDCAIIFRDLGDLGFTTEMVLPEMDGDDNTPANVQICVAIALRLGKEPEFADNILEWINSKVEESNAN